MAGMNSTRIRVANTGNVYKRPVGSPEATDPAVVPSGALDLGFTSEDGVTISISRESDDIMVWQQPEPGRVLVTGSGKEISFVLRQVEADTWLATMGGTITELASGIYKWVPDDSSIPEAEIDVHWKDGDKDYLFCFRRAQNKAEVELQMQRGAAVDLPNTWSALAAPDGGASWYMITNDANWNPSKLPTVATIAPVGGATAGGTAVTLTGSNFTGATVVKFGTTNATDLVVVNDTQITVTSPAGTAGPKNVSVTTPQGVGTLTNGYVYY